MEETSERAMEEAFAFQDKLMPDVAQFVQETKAK